MIVDPSDPGSFNRFGGEVQLSVPANPNCGSVVVGPARILAYSARPVADSNRPNTPVGLFFQEGYNIGSVFVPGPRPKAHLCSLESRLGMHPIYVGRNVVVGPGEAVEFSTEPEGYLAVYTYVEEP